MSLTRIEHVVGDLQGSLYDRIQRATTDPDTGLVTLLPIDLSSPSILSVDYSQRPYAGTTVTGGTMTILDGTVDSVVYSGTAGDVKYDWGTADVATAGTFVAWETVNYSDGTTWTLSPFIVEFTDPGSLQPETPASFVSAWEVAENLGVDAEQRAEDAAEAATAMIRAYTGRTLSYTEGAVETLDGTGRERFSLKEWPVGTVSTVVEDGGTVSSSDYTYSSLGIVEHSSRCWTNTLSGLVVTYTHGYDPLPREIRQAALSIAGRFYQSGAAAAVRSETLGSYSVTYSDYASNTGLMAWEEAVLARYKRAD